MSSVLVIQGLGKSSFINCFLGKQDNLKTSGDGKSYTMNTIVDQGSHKDVGDINFIDTRGANDTNEFDDSAIFHGLFSYFLKVSKINSKVDAILYFHDYNQKAHYYADVRSL